MDTDAEPSVFSYVLSFLLVGVAWGFTTPFIRRAAADFNARQDELKTGVAPQHKKEEKGRKNNGSQQQRNEPGTDTKPEAEGRSLRRRVINDAKKNGNANEDEMEEDTSISAERDSVSTSSSSPWLQAKIGAVFWTVANLLRTPAYSIPLVINLTGSVWFFLLVGKHGTLSLISDSDL